MGKALLAAQLGTKALNTKPMKGFRGASVLEMVEDFDGDTYRAVYTVRFRRAVYVLHVFKKKSRRGIETPKRDVERIERRLGWAEEDYRVKYGD